MKPTRWLALAAAVTGCAVAYGVHVFGKPDVERTATAGSDKAVSTAAARARSSFKPAASSAAGRRPRLESRDTTASAKTPAATQTRKVLGSPASSGGQLLSESQWRENAAKVEVAANHELDRLVGLLDLDSAQQEKVFSVLAQQSPHWMPGMQTGGSVRSGDSSGSLSSAVAANQGRPTRNGGAANATGSTAVVTGGPTAGSLVSSAGSSQPATVDLTAYLTADQQQSLVEEEMDRQAWWAEVLPQLLPPTISDGTTAVTSASGTAITTDPAPETKEFDGGDMLLEE